MYGYGYRGVFRTLAGGAPAPAPEFIMLVKTDNAGTSASDQFTIPTTGAGYNYDVDWGDSTTSTGLTGSTTHTFPSAGNYVIKISGLFPRLYSFGSTDVNKIIDVLNWGNIAWGNSLQWMFFNADSLTTLSATDTPDFSSTTDLRDFFRASNNFIGGGNIENWDVSNVTNMVTMFFGAISFNQNLGNWEIASLTNAISIFSSSGMSTANYTDTIVGWANYVFASGVPINVNMGSQTGMTFDTSRSGGANFANAGAARIYLTTATPIGAGWTISGDTVI